MENNAIDFLLDDIRKACELGDIEEVILLADKLKELNQSNKYPKHIGKYKEITDKIKNATKLN